MKQEEASAESRRAIVALRGTIVGARLLEAVDVGGGRTQRGPPAVGEPPGAEPIEIRAIRRLGVGRWVADDPGPDQGVEVGVAARMLHHILRPATMAA